MANLSFIEKETLRRLFGIEAGFIFKFWSDKQLYNKNKTKDLVADSCGINIYEDPDFRELSQQKCIEKIWNEKDARTVANLIESLCNYFSFQMGSDYWSNEDQWDYQQAQEIIKRLRSNQEVTLPPTEDTPDLRLLASDIETNIQQDKPELALDRLHTYATKYIRSICARHDIDTADSSGKSYSLDGLVGQLRKHYESQHLCESEFSIVALKASTSLFSRFNDIRNDHSFSHPNPVLNKHEAIYVVKMMLATLLFINAIEETSSNPFLDLDTEDTDDLPF